MSWRPDPGWLLYSGPEGTLAGQVYQLHLSMHTNTIDISSIDSGNYMRVAGPPQVTVTAEMVGETLTRNTTRPPVNYKALLVLAARHPEEYEELCETEDVLKALGG